MAKFAKIIHENNENFLIRKFIELFTQRLHKSIKARGKFSCVLTGGKSPIKLYKELAKEKLPWNKINFFITDERFVKENSNHSNIKMCKKYLLNKIKISNDQIYNISTKKSLIAETINYDEKIKDYFFNKKVIFDLILLGIGDDGHIASLSMNESLLNYKKRSKLNYNVEFTIWKDFSRITLNLKCINNCRRIFLWAPSKKKSIIIKKIIADKRLKYPTSFLKKEISFLFHSN